MKKTVDQLSLDALIGPAQVVAVKSKDRVRLSDIRDLDLKKTRRVLFKTRNSGRMKDGKFHADYVALSPEVARRLRNHRVRLVGIDAMSVDPKGGNSEAHRLLLSAGAVLLENINLSRVPAGEYDLICLPLRLKDADGAPARVVLRAIT
jgi:arylformamidase